MECAECGGGGACHTVAGTQSRADIRSEVLGAQEAYAYIEQQQQRRQILQTFLGDGVEAQFQGEDAQQDGQLENKLGSLICVQVIINVQNMNPCDIFPSNWAMILSVYNVCCRLYIHICKRI